MERAFHREKVGLQDDRNLVPQSNSTISWTGSHGMVAERRKPRSEAIFCLIPRFHEFFHNFFYKGYMVLGSLTFFYYFSYTTYNK